MFLTFRFSQGGMVALLVGHWTCDSQVAASSPARGIVVPWASYLHLCASVTKQYNLVPAKGGDVLWLGR